MQAVPPSPADLASMPRPMLRQWCTDRGMPPFRAEQIFQWLHVAQVRDWAAMTDLPATLRATLAAEASLPQLAVQVDRTSALDGSRKIALATRHGQAIETVLMPMEAGVTQCLSSQVGCKMGCDFCATARIATRANLTAGEIVEQVALACRLAVESGLARGGVAGGQSGLLAGRPRNLVFMGMGEPLDNLDAVVAALDILCDPKGYAFSPRRITVSTVGLARFVPRLAAAHPGVHLAWSLTATRDEVRDRLMPVNKGVPIARMVEALRALPSHPHRKITFEYALLHGHNDTADDARTLGIMALQVGAHINAIPFNAWPGSAYRRPPRAVITRFVREVQATGASISLRESRGQDIGAACGQLAGERPA
ncbi:MAG: 23S rRNA (adenine(2503)-C(2))-methyltransferase RlmN [Deltaproteobacteria bacterium]|nr:23S rRNA (adenine(2503)-C(2))-methyltransferase RlmN [Deltaproteobacteria bacterium]